MNWIHITEKDQIDQIIGNKDVVSLIFKHSTSCSISAVTLDRIERKAQRAQTENLMTYFLDLLSYREISNYVSEVTGVRHESPQAILIKDGKVVYEASHFGIDLDEIHHSANTN